MINFDVTVNYQQAAVDTPGVITFQSDSLTADGRLTGIGTSVGHVGQFMITDSNSLMNGEPCGPFTVDIVCTQVGDNTMDIELTFTYRPDLGINAYFTQCAQYTSLPMGGTSVHTISSVAF